MTSADESGPLEEQQGTPTALKRLRSYFAQDVDASWTDSLLLVTSVVTGLLDSAVYNVFTCFVSMQTGNTLYVGLGVSGQPASSPYRWVKSLSAILCFSIGCFFFSRVSRWMGELRRSTMLSLWALQAILVFVSAAIFASDLIPPHAGESRNLDPIILLPLGLLSFQSGGQIVQSRLLAFSELPTVVLTSTYCDLMLDPHLLTASPLRNSKRNRRVISVIALVVGAVAGGYLTKGGEITNALWISGGVKMLCALCWIFWKGKSSIRLE